MNSVPNIQFGLGFCESSGPCFVRHEGNDAELRRLAAEKAFEIGCGHSFLIFIKNAYPLNVLDKIKKVPEVCTVYAATANPLEVIIAETAQGRGIIGVVDGLKSKGIETDEDIAERRTVPEENRLQTRVNAWRTINYFSSLKNQTLTDLAMCFYGFREKHGST